MGSLVRPSDEKNHFAYSCSSFQQVIGNTHSKRFFQKNFEIYRSHRVPFWNVVQKRVRFNWKIQGTGEKFRDAFADSC